MEDKPKILKWALIIGIVIVLNLFFNYSISLFYKEPNYGAFCWPQPMQVPSGNVFLDSHYARCQNDFQTAENIYNRNVFIALVILGVVSLVVGAFVANAIVSLGLSWGGALSLLVASMRYWSTAGNIIKVLILAFALVALIWLAIKKFGN